MLRSIVLSIAPLFSSPGGGTRTGNQEEETPMAEKTTLVDAVKVCNPDLSLFSMDLF